MLLCLLNIKALGKSTGLWNRVIRGYNSKEAFYFFDSFGVSSLTFSIFLGRCHPFISISEWRFLLVTLTGNTYLSQTRYSLEHQKKVTSYMPNKFY